MRLETVRVWRPQAGKNSTHRAKAILAGIKMSWTKTSKLKKFKFDTRLNGGEGGIRTHGTDKSTTIFETVPFDHSGTSPFSLKFECWILTLDYGNSKQNIKSPLILKIILDCIKGQSPKSESNLMKSQVLGQDLSHQLASKQE